MKLSAIQASRSFLRSRQGSNTLCAVAPTDLSLEEGSLTALSIGALLYVTSTTGLGLLISTFTKTQISALFGTAILTMLPTTSFSGLKDPIGSLEGSAYWIGQFFPASQENPALNFSNHRAIKFPNALFQSTNSNRRQETANLKRHGEQVQRQLFHLSAGSAIRMTSLK